MGKAGRGQAIVTATWLTLRGAGNWDPLLTQLGWFGVGWVQAIVSTSRLQLHLCTYLPRP